MESLSQMLGTQGDVLLATVFLLVSAAVAATLFGVRSLFVARDARIDRRIRASVATSGSVMSSVPLTLTDRQGSTMVDAIVKPLGALATPGDQEELEGIRARLQHAGYRREHALYYFAATKVVLCLLLAAIAVYFTSRTVMPVERSALNVIVAMMLGFYAPNVWLSGRIKERQTELLHGLPDALDLLITCVEAGLGLDLAINRVATEIQPATPLLSTELTQTALEMRAGLTRGEAARRLARRTGVDDLKYFASVLVQTETFGTSIAKSLRVMAESIRVSRMQRAEKRAATVAVKMTLPLVMFILPSLFLIVLGPAIINIVETMLPALSGK